MSIEADRQRLEEEDVLFKRAKAVATLLMCFEEIRYGRLSDDVWSDRRDRLIDSLMMTFTAEAADSRYGIINRDT